MVNATTQPLYSPPTRKDPVPILQEAGWAPGPVWTGAENLVHTGIRSSVRPARSESQYRLSYPGPLTVWVQSLNTRDDGRRKHTGTVKDSSLYHCVTFILLVNIC